MNVLFVKCTYKKTPNIVEHVTGAATNSIITAYGSTTASANKTINIL